MSLKHAILGLLTFQPMTGYDLKHLAFDSTVAHFWRADQAQIYRTLDNMEQEGFLTSDIQLQTERPSKRIYAITDAGRAELLAWLRQPQSPPVYREPFLVQVFFAGLLTDAEILAHIQTHITAHREKLAKLQEIDIPETVIEDQERDKLFWGMSLELGIAVEHTYLAWLEKWERVIRDRSAGEGDSEG
ncbi:MAG: PadR family transcriptional regulator [Anaerolineaceae bacterium]|nr:PadR family transcriptional regulator [Anaerolineaceae bacterium]